MNTQSNHGAAHVQACALMVIFAITICEKIPDAHVTCNFSMDCVLPCQFKPADVEAIQWYRQNALIHSFLNGSEMLDQQNERYRGRTSLFREEFTQGNASLLLKHSDIHDRGRYKCHVRTALGDQESVVITKVEAPIRSLTLHMTGPGRYEEVMCSSQNIYPAPQLWWSTDPVVPADALKPTTRKTANEQGLYSVESTQRRLGNLSDFTYICNLNLSYGSQMWKASLREREIYTVSGKTLTIPCLTPRTFKLHNFSLTWTFTKANKTTVILMFDSLSHQTSNLWENQARVDPDQVLSGNGSLQLQNLESSAQTGTYSCAFSASNIQHLVHNHISFTAAATGGHQSNLWIIAVVIAALVLFIAGIAVYTSRKESHPQPGRTEAEGTIEIHNVRKETGENTTRDNEVL
ncbi:hypothetical protein AGOR_G00024250 [Albula goreensis]|uniref:Ig-like domain-containing protein n=1 Tax=Albula goreensis TaxID=1534307 RepID=A0A8T3E3E8_9TELE|nr:hypothetical protein AGOR_G00024250 [Albula goreensis]